MVLNRGLSFLGLHQTGERSGLGRPSKLNEIGVSNLAVGGLDDIIDMFDIDDFVQLGEMNRVIDMFDIDDFVQLGEMNRVIDMFDIYDFVQLGEMNRVIDMFDIDDFVQLGEISGPLRGIILIPLLFVLGLHQTGQGSGLCNVHAAVHERLKSTSTAR